MADFTPFKHVGQPSAFRFWSASLSAVAPGLTLGKAGQQLQAYLNRAAAGNQPGIPLFRPCAATRA
jgi:hypothetical protein